MRTVPLRRLEALTSLRFVAAAAVVFYHSRGSFGLPQDITFGDTIPLYTGVSFFFILSGFILAYIYPAFGGAGEAGRFLWARFSRVWPAHAFVWGVAVAASGLANADFSRLDRCAGAAANLLMVNAWIPIDRFCSSFLVGNPVSWSVSTEFGFYVLFPVLIWRFSRLWPVKLFVTAALAAGTVAACVYWRLPPKSDDGISAHCLLYQNPVARVFEFTLGMTAAHFYRRIHSKFKPSLLTGTVIESATFALVAVNGYYSRPLATWSVTTLGLPDAVRIWFDTAGAMCPSLALLVLVCAMEWGLLTRFLRQAVFVWLGEISYSIYLYHLIMIGYFCQHPRAFVGVPDWQLLVGFWAILLAASHLTSTLIETPARVFLLALWPNPRSEVGYPATLTTKRPGSPRPAWLARFVPTRTHAVVALEMTALAAAVYACERRPYRFLPTEAVENYWRWSPPDRRDVRFGDRCVLRGAVVSPVDQGVRLELAWQSCRRQNLDGYVVLHVCDKNGEVLSTEDYRRDTHGRAVEAEQAWLETTVIPVGKLRSSDGREAEYLAVGCGEFDPAPGGVALLPPDRGFLDSHKCRLMIPIAPDMAADARNLRRIADIRSRSAPAFHDIRFGDEYLLRASAVARGGEGGLTLDLVWESCRQQRRDAYVAVHLCDQEGKVLEDASYVQDFQRRRVDEGAVWAESKVIPGDKVRSAAGRGLAFIAIGSGITDAPPDRVGLRKPDRGPLDSFRLRVMIPVPGRCQNAPPAGTLTARKK